MNKLQGKIALITGGSTGIGLATAKRFVTEGAYVFITGRREAELAASVKEIGATVTGVQGDVSNLADLDRLFAQIKREKGKLDIVFANAGGAQFAPLGKVTEDHFDALFNGNVKGLLFTVQNLKHRRIRVNAVSPGYTDTPPWHSVEGADQLMKNISTSVPLGRFGTPDEIAKAVVFLASDDSSYITGTELFVDGGFAQT